MCARLTQREYLRFRRLIPHWHYSWTSQAEAAATALNAPWWAEGLARMGEEVELVHGSGSNHPVTPTITLPKTGRGIAVVYEEGLIYDPDEPEEYQGIPWSQYKRDKQVRLMAFVEKKA